LNLINVDVLCLQRIGIFGGPSGRHFAAVAATSPDAGGYHLTYDPERSDARTKAGAPGGDQALRRVVSMAEKGIEFLRDIYETPVDKIDLILTAFLTAICRSELLQGQIWGGGAPGFAHLRPSLAKQGYRTCPQRAASGRAIFPRS
jgi:hypothetical protein